MTVEEAIQSERDRCLAIVEENMERLPNYNPHSDEDLEDKVEQGYGNACLNIKVSIQQARE